MSQTRAHNNVITIIIIPTKKKIIIKYSGAAIAFSALCYARLQDGGDEHLASCTRAPVVAAADGLRGHEEQLPSPPPPPQVTYDAIPLFFVRRVLRINTRARAPAHQLLSLVIIILERKYITRRGSSSSSRARVRVYTGLFLFFFYRETTSRVFVY